MNIRIAAAAAVLLALLGGASRAEPRYAVVDRIPGPDGGWDYLQVDTEHNQLLIPRGTAVMRVGLDNHKIETGLAPGGREHVALPLPGGREMLVTNGATDTAIFADAVSGSVLASVPVAKGPDAAVLDPMSGLVLVAGHAAGAVTLVDPKTRQAVGSVPVGGVLEELAVDGRGRAFVAVETKNEIAVIDVRGRKTVAHWPLPGCEGPTGLAYAPQDQRLIAACDGETAIVDATDGKLIQMLDTGLGADGAAYDARRHVAFVPAGRDGVLNIIGIRNGRATLLQVLPTERGARTLALDARTGRVYLPAAEYQASAGGRPMTRPGTFRILVIAPQ